MASTSYTSPTPYSKPLKALLVVKGEEKTFTTSNGDVKHFVQLGLATPEKALKAFHYDPQTIKHIKDGHHIIIRNYITRQDGNITLNMKTQIFRTASFDVEDEIRKAAGDLIHPPEAPSMSLKDAATSPMKSTVSIKGYIIQDESPREVNVGGRPTPVRGLVMEDDTSKLKVSLWRDNAASKMKLGDYAEITNLTMSKFNSDVTAGTTSRTTIKILDPPLTPKTIDVEGAMPTGTGFQLITTNAGTYTVTADILARHLRIEQEDVMEQLISLFPWSAEINAKGMEIASFQEI